MQKKLVLVTGASGFIGSHCVLALLKKGYAVRSVVRSSSRIEKCQAMIKSHYSEDADVEYIIATLDADEGWDDAAKGCEYVIHLASPLPLEEPKDPNELIVPARDGTLRVLRAGSRAGVKRIVMTSSQAAICGAPVRKSDYIYSEKDWTDPNDKKLSPYVKSKIIAELAAWDFVSKEKSMELATICPGLVFGPILQPKANTSLEAIKRMMAGDMPLIPPIGHEIVDVRDVVNLHILAMEKPNGAEGRFIATAGFMWFHEIAATLRDNLGEKVDKVPNSIMSSWLARLLSAWLTRFFALFDPLVARAVPELNQFKRLSNQTSKEELGWIPRPPEEAIIATAKSLLAYGVLDA